MIAADFAVDAALMHAIFAIAYLHIEKFVRRSLVGKNDAEVRIPHVTG
jgi:TnpA family transposase